MVNEPEPVPESIGPYRVVRPVARGGMAAVYEVIEPDTGRHLALKLLERRFRGHHRFGREYRALTRLDHPNIVRVYRFGVADDNTPFLTMELLDGVPAQVYAKKCGRPGTPERTREAIRIIGEVARALAYLHRRGVVHRDLKSSNVLVLRDGRIKVLDFGTARLADAAESITRHGEFVGTYAYAAPEQFQGGGVDARTDLYSLGVLFYRLLTGHRPFDSDDPEELRRMHTHDVPNSPCARVPGIPTEVGEVVLHLLQKIPDERPDSAARVEQALHRHSGERPRHLTMPQPDVTGRSALLGEVQAWLGRTDAAVGHGLVLGGPAGVGAPRLLRQARVCAEGLGWTVLQTRITGVPGIRGLAGLVRAVCRWGGVRSDPELGFVLAAVTRAPSPGAPTVETPDRLVRVLKRAFERRDRPTLLTVRDLDQAPPDVLATLGCILRCGADVSLVATVSVDTPSIRQRLEALLAPLHFLAIPALDRPGCYRLVGAVLGVRAPPPALVERVHLATGGRPGFVVEVVHAMQTHGLAGSDEQLQPVDLSGGRVPLPESVAVALRGQLRSLSTGALRILQVLALAGESVTTIIISRVIGTPEHDVARELASLVEAGLVEAVAQGAAWRLPLELLGEVIRAGLRTTRRDVLVRSLASGLAHATPGPGLVRLLLEAGQLAEASRAAVRWGAAALEQGRPDRVGPVVGRVVHAWGGLRTPRGCPGPLRLLQASSWVDLEPGSGRTSEVIEALGRRSDVPRATSAFLLARHLRWRPELERAARELDMAGRLAREADNGPVAIRVSLARAADALDRGAFAGAEAELDGLASRVRKESDPGYRLEVAALHARLWTLRGDGSRSLAVLDAVAGDLRWAGPRVRHHHAVARGAALAILERWSEMLGDVISPALALVRIWGDPVAHASLLSEAVRARVALFQLGEARDLLEESRAAGLRGLPWFRVRRAGFDGLLQEHSGAADGASTTLRECADTAARYGLRIEEACARARLGRALIGEGRIDEAVSALDAARGVVSNLEPGLHEEEVETCRVEALLRPEARQATDWRAMAARAHGLVRSPRPRTRVRACVALLESRCLRDEQWASVVAAARSSLLDLESGLTGEARAAFRIHPWRVAIERAASDMAPSNK